MTHTTQLEPELPELPMQHEEMRAHWKCDSCNGSGHMGEMRDMGYFQPPEPHLCTDCDGKGYVPTEAFTAEDMRAYALAAIAADRNKREGAVQTDMLTPLDKMPGYTDPLIFGRYSVRDYHVAPSGEGPRAGDWADKPHRLVYDLCRALLSLASKQMGPVNRPDAPVSAGLSKLLVDVATAVMEERRLLSRMDDKDTQAFCEELDAEFARALSSRLLPPDWVAVKKNAERYLWLRDSALGFDQVGSFTPYAVKGQLMNPLEGKALDVAIDAAIAAAPMPKEG